MTKLSIIVPVAESETKHLDLLNNLKNLEYENYEIILVTEVEE